MILEAALAASIAMQRSGFPIRPEMPQIAETREEKDARMSWWRDARFGLFIHWGIYSIPAGEWMGSDGHGEWIKETAQIPSDAYDRFVPHFNPRKFDAKEWVSLAKEAGMKYIVITSKHHDGFAIYDSAVSNYDVMATPFKRDILKELAEECAKQGIVLCFYHSIMDWHHPDYLPRRDWEKEMRPQGNADMDRYVRYLHSQVTELLTKYGPIGVMWFDGEWERTWNHAYGQALYDLCRKLQPNVIVNNRVDVGRGGMGGMSDAGFAGDFGTPEQEIPARGLPGVDWETCMTMNRFWGYNRNDTQYKSTRELLHNLVDIASKGGNYLLNVGPTSLGEFPEESVTRLKEIGKWMRDNGEAIYGTSASAFEYLPWGRCTVKYGKDKATYYLHIFDWPARGVLLIPGLGTDPDRVSILSGDKTLKWQRSETDILVLLPEKQPHADVNVIALEFVNYPPIVYAPPKVEALSRQFVDAIDVRVSVGAGLTARYTLDGTEPTAASAVVSAPLRLSETSSLKVRAFHGEKPISGVEQHEFTKVLPRPADTPENPLPGLQASFYQGTWSALPDFGAMPATGTATAEALTVFGPMDAEFVGARFEGYLRVPTASVYLFELTSDDGSRMSIGDSIVIDNDGEHSPLAKYGEIALDSGLHRIRVDWFNKAGGAVLRLRMTDIASGEYREVSSGELARDRHP